MGNCCRATSVMISIQRPRKSGFAPWNTCYVCPSFRRPITCYVAKCLLEYRDHECVGLALRTVQMSLSFPEKGVRPVWRPRSCTSAVGRCQGIIVHMTVSGSSVSCACVFLMIFVSIFVPALVIFEFGYRSDLQNDRRYNDFPLKACDIT